MIVIQQIFNRIVNITSQKGSIIILNKENSSFNYKRDKQMKKQILMDFENSHSYSWQVRYEYFKMNFKLVEICFLWVIVYFGSIALLIIQVY